MFNLRNIDNIKGYDKLTVNREMFKKFLNNFINSWGLEARETIIPLSAKYCKDREGKYLRFEYEIYGKKECLHVTSPTTWW